MATPFQPEKPYPPARHGRGRSSYVVMAVVSALLVMMILALASPGLFGSQGIGWLVIIVVGVIVFAAIVIWGNIRGRNNQGTAE